MTQRSRVILYSRPGCHLCDEMKAEIRRADCAELYIMEEVDIEGDAELLTRYRYEIPVLTIDGVEAFRYQLKAEDFRAKLSRRPR